MSNLATTMTGRPAISTAGVLRLTRLKAVDKLLAGVLDKTTALTEINRRYQQLPASQNAGEFLQHALTVLDTHYHVDPAALENIPRSGAVVVVANHPFGAIEGIVMAHLLRRIRSDVRIIANQYLSQITELRHLFFDVDALGGKNSAQRNLKPLRDSIRWVQQGGLLLIFPSGTVSHLTLRPATITDPEWNPLVAHIVRKTQATVVPVFIHGHNSLLFQLAGLLHPRLRTALLPREMLKTAQRQLRFSIGKALPYASLPNFCDNHSMTLYLRMRTYLLAQPIPHATPLNCAEQALPLPLAEPVCAQRLRAEFAALPRAQTLVQQDEWQVVLARAPQLTWCLQELGRLREITYRAVGEGSGKARDLDLYDQHYLHLILWNKRDRQIAGAYRLAETDRIVRHYGLRGLYTYSLFDFPLRLLQTLPPTLELGRSFVRPEYQRSFAPLLLLWRGIGEFLLRHPRYRALFGPVSISNEYQRLSRALLVNFLQHTRSLALAKMVKPRQRFHAATQPIWPALDYSALQDTDAVEGLLTGIEPDGKGIPVLLRHYLKLGGKFLGFNVDRKFSDSLDGLVMVNLDQVEPRLLARYLGKNGAAQFLAAGQPHHARPASG